MPRQGQIIPEYQHPHVETYINDNTIVQPIVNPAVDGYRFISVFASGKGRDNVLLQFDNNPDYIEEYGNPSYKIYGQPGYMPYAYLSTGQAKGWCMRVMPMDAAYANVVIVAKVKVNTPGEGETGSPSLIIKHEASFIPNLVNKEEFGALVDAMEDGDPDIDGFMTYPLFGAYVQGRGVYGNNFRIRISSATQADKDNNYKNFRIEVIDAENSLVIKEVFSGSFFSQAKIDNSTLFIEDIINDLEDGSDKINFYVAESSFETIYNLYKTEVLPTPTTDLTLDMFNPINGKTKTATTIDGITIDSSAVALDAAEGVVLVGGTDGSFALSADPQVRETAINNAYIKAFKGELDKAILSKRRTPAEFFMDANYASEVKTELIGLYLKRNDVYGYIDGGILNNVTEAITWGEDIVTVGNRNFGKEFQHFLIKDPFSGKNIPMTMTYYLASKLPIHFKIYGNHIPFVGEAYANLTGIIKGSLKPIVDADEDDIKEQLYNLKLNYFECIAENTFVRGTQSTSQNILSDLSEENNMQVLFEIKRKVESLVASLLYNFAEAEDRQRFTETVDRILTPYKSVKIKSANVRFAMSAFETERSILHCYLELTYLTTAKIGIVEIDINKRT